MHYDTFKEEDKYILIPLDRLKTKLLNTRRKEKYQKTHQQSSSRIAITITCSCLFFLVHQVKEVSPAFGSTLGSLFSGRQQFSGNLMGTTGSINTIGPSGALTMGSAGGVMGTRIMSNAGNSFGRLQNQPQSGNILSGLIPGLDGLFGGGGDGGGGGGLLPPGMTMTQDGCLCPIPKGRTKYIAVEVPKIIFVPPKEKTKVITIKEIREVPASKYSKDEEDGSEEDDSGVSFDEGRGGSKGEDSYRS